MFRTRVGSNGMEQWEGIMGRNNGKEQWEGTMGRNNGMEQWDGTMGWNKSRENELIVSHYCVDIIPLSIFLNLFIFSFIFKHSQQANLFKNENELSFLKNTLPSSCVNRLKQNIHIIFNFLHNYFINISTFLLTNFTISIVY